MRSPPGCGIFPIANALHSKLLNLNEDDNSQDLTTNAE